MFASCRAATPLGLLSADSRSAVIGDVGAGAAAGCEGLTGAAFDQPSTGAFGVLYKVIRLLVQRPCQRFHDVESRGLLAAFALTYLIPSEIRVLCHSADAVGRRMAAPRDQFRTASACGASTSRRRRPVPCLGDVGITVLGGGQQRLNGRGFGLKGPTGRPLDDNAMPASARRRALGDGAGVLVRRAKRDATLGDPVSLGGFLHRQARQLVLEEAVCPSMCPCLRSQAHEAV